MGQNHSGQTVLKNSEIETNRQIYTEIVNMSGTIVRKKNSIQIERRQYTKKGLAKKIYNKNHILGFRCKIQNFKRKSLLLKDAIFL